MSVEATPAGKRHDAAFRGRRSLAAEAQADKRGEVGSIKIELNPDQLGIPGGGNVELVGFDYWDNTFIAPAWKP